jgi:hypothetical protein
MRWKGHVPLMNKMRNSHIISSRTYKEDKNSLTIAHMSEDNINVYKSLGPASRVTHGKLKVV